MTVNFRIHGDPDAIVAVLFRRAEEGVLHFGFSARASEAESLDDLEERFVTFKEIVMEAPVQYGLQVARWSGGVDLSLGLLGSSRDASLEGWIRGWLRQQGLRVD